MSGPIVAPLPARAEDDPRNKTPDDPFAAPPEQEDEQRAPLSQDPFLNPPTQDDLWSAAYGGDAGAAEDTAEDETAYIVPSDAFDPNPPMKPNGERVNIDLVRDYQLKQQLRRAFEPLKKSIGPSFDKLSKFGYSEPTTDPFAEGMQSQLRKLTRSL